jgi:hypothetical protein
MAGNMIEQYANANGAYLEFGDPYGARVPGWGDETKIRFLAFLQEFSQTFSITWDKEAVYGRNDPIATYRNTARAMSLSWTLPAGDIWEAKLNYLKSRLLVRMLYPTYRNSLPIPKETKKTNPRAKKLYQKTIDANKIFSKMKRQIGEHKFGDAQKEYFRIRLALKQEATPMSFADSGDLELRGMHHTQTLYSNPLIKLKFANLISAADGEPLIGYLDNLAVKPILDAGFFSQQSCEYKLKSGESIKEEDGQFPKVLSLSCNFNIFHADPLGFDGFTGKPYSQIFNLGE